MIYFSDFFEVDENIIEDYGAFNISLINDLPLFIDPFLLFGGKKRDYLELHEEILKYLKFLKGKSEKGIYNIAQIKSWYLFPEVKQNWFGYSMVGNSGSGLGYKFGKSLSSNLHRIFDDLGNEKITMSSHLEKTSLFEIGIGRDNISDFTVNLIKKYLLQYTEKFAQMYVADNQKKVIKVNKVYFDYDFERWMPKDFVLPFWDDDYVLLTPKDILTKDENWINSNDLRANFEKICTSIPNDQLREEIFNYFRKRIPPKVNHQKPSQKELTKAILKTLRQFPEIINQYIKIKEENKQGARSISEIMVKQVEEIFVNHVQTLVEHLKGTTNFYNNNPVGSYEETHQRIKFLKSVIEDKDGYKLFYIKGEPIKREQDLQIMFRLTWFATSYDIIPEANAGRGPVDYVISKGANDKTLAEFKLASNKKLKQNLAKQVEVYKKAHDTDLGFKVILYFNDKEFKTVNRILKELNLENREDIVLIDAGKKESASNVKLFQL